MTQSPFKFNSEIHNALKKDLLNVITFDGNRIKEAEVEARLDAFYKWIVTTPGSTTYRVNILKTSAEDVAKHLRHIIIQHANHIPTILTYSHLPEVVTVKKWDESIELNLTKYNKQIIVDTSCGSAVLRGAHIFAPGVIGIPQGLAIGDVVSVFVDITGSCKKGLLTPNEIKNKVFLGNGIVEQTRQNLFGNNVQIANGIAVRMVAIISRLPQLNDNSIPYGWALLQNLPSILCTRILDPQPGELILDMCAAPGNKTTHISALMNGKGIVIALEKNKKKLEKIRENCDKFSSGNVNIFCWDSTTAVLDSNSNVQNTSVKDGPPFKENSFDRILLDGPCSGLGQRPQLLNKISIEQLHSFVPLQKKLFSAAVRLLKPNGILVYSTCTVTVAENEGIVLWALKKYPCLKLRSTRHQLNLDSYSSRGYIVDGLTIEQTEKLCRFGSENDTIGFFVACFRKNISSKDETEDNI